MKNMEKLYYQTPYVKEFTAEVVSCQELRSGYYQVVLDRTGFYPGGGGQPFDTGTLTRIDESDTKRRFRPAKVIGVREKDGQVIHDIDQEFQIGSKVTGKIDWEKRLVNMQLHSGEHLLSGLIYHHYGFDNVGFHMGTEEVTVDFNGTLEPEQIKSLELEANRLIYEDLPIESSYPDEDELHKLDYRSKKELEGPVRIVTIPGADLCACCGTHVARTGEIGIIKVLGMIHYKGGIRISMLCGKKALMDYQKKQDIIAVLSNQLSAKPEMITEAIEKLKRDNIEKEATLSQMYTEIYDIKSEIYPSREEPLVLFERNMEPAQLRQYCTILFEKQKGSIVLVCSGEENNYQYAIGSRNRNMKQFAQVLNEKLNGKGGGSSLLAQGTFHATREEIIEAMS